MPGPMRARVSGAAILVATLVLPLCGAVVGGRPLDRILEFPPRLAIPATFPRFSWVALVLVVAPFAALALAWATGRHQHRPLPAASVSEFRFTAEPRRRRFPWWGWLAIGWLVLWWVLAWTRFPWFAAAQRFTFFPLWFGFVVVVNAITVGRAGTSAMVATPARWLALFLISGAFWWVFEWLNRFSRNWHYLGVSDFGALSYAANATLCFSTVLPAVAGVRGLLDTSAAWKRACGAGPRLPWLNSRVTGTVLIAAGAVSLFATGALPRRFYPALWAAPLAMLLGDDILAARTGPAAEVSRGDWRRTGSWATAALICGFFWELWNFGSAAHWTYTVPYVDYAHLFAMPLLGYAGYLPFGLECYFAVARTVGNDEPFSSASST